MSNSVVKLYQKSQENTTQYIDEVLKNTLLRTLPKRFRAFKNKYFVSKKTIYKETALSTCRWIEYNKFTVNFAIIDIDEKKRFGDFNGGIQSLNYYITEVLFLPAPTWLLETDKGWQICWQLKTPFPTNYKSKEYRWIKDIKKHYIELIDADRSANSIRGIYRNPLLHNHLYENNTYTLDELALPREQKPKMKFLKPLERINDEIKYLARVIFLQQIFQKKTLTSTSIQVGQRNQTLYYIGMMYAKYQNTHDTKKIQDFLNRISRIYCKAKLSENELRSIAKSVARYQSEGRNKVSIFAKRYKNWDRETKNRYQKEYRKKKKGKIMTKTEAAINAAKINSSRAKQKVVKAVEELKEQKAKINIANVARTAKVDRGTAKKYLIELGHIKSKKRSKK